MGGPPSICKANPGTWTDEVDLVPLAGSALTAGGHAVEQRTGWLHHAESGFAITPRIALIQPLPDGGVRTATTVQVNHPTLVPDGVFEYQHATGDTLAEAISNGFSQWAELDFVTLLDALEPVPRSCLTLQFDFPAAAGRPARRRRAVLGPVSHVAASQLTEASCSEDGGHSFCPCCLLTRSFDAFRSLIDGDGFFCLRLLALRDRDGSQGADCRINGEDWEPGARALREYVRSWPPLGFELRKQLVILQTLGSTNV